jgi:hypothetical protein
LNVEEGVEDEGKWRMKEEWRQQPCIAAEHQHAFRLPAPPTSKHEENNKKQTFSDNAQEKG